VWNCGVLGDTVITQGIKPNSDHVIAVQEYPVLAPAKAVRQFVEIVSYN